ncbi:MAG: hypothetical protein JRF18_01935, partial [Deltaproteobacteria bacterium]|nr:hypothetical protein [Deltaproteobacteria bacterium]
AKEGTKLNTLINLVSNNSLVEQSALMDKIGVAKAAEITEFLQAVPQGGGSLTPGMEDKLDRILAMLQP